MADGYVSGGGGSSCGGTPLQARRPPLPPAKEGASQGPKGSTPKGVRGRGQRPASLLMLGDVALASAAAASPPGSPKHHVAFRSHSAEDGSVGVAGAKAGSCASLLSSLRARKSNTSLNDALLMTPASSAERLHRLKDKLLLRSAAQLASASATEARDVELGLAERNGCDLDSDDESTPLVSEMSSPGAGGPPSAAAAASNDSHFLNRGFSIAGASDSNSGSSDNSPSSVKSTPLSSPPPKQEANNGNVDTLVPNGLGASNANLANSQRGSTASLSQLLEPASNYYHLVAVSGSGSAGSGVPGGPPPASSPTHSLLARQDAVKDSSDDEWSAAHPETTV